MSIFAKVARLAGKVAGIINGRQQHFPERYCPIDRHPMYPLKGYNDLWVCPQGHRFQYGETAPKLDPKPKYEGEI